MRVDLEQLSTAAARIELGAKEGTAQFVQIAETSGLRGVLEQTPGRVEISDCSADVLAVREAQLRFGTVLLQVAANLVLKRMVTSVVSTEEVAIQLSSEQVQCGKLSIAAGTVTVSGEVLMRTCTLVQAERGSVVADYAEITNLALDLGAMRVRVPHVVIHEFKTGWGDPDGFWLSAKSVRALDLELGMANITSRASALVCEDVLVRDGGFYVASAKADRLDAHTDAPAKTRSEAPADADPASANEPRHDAQAAAPRYVDWTVLDGLAGHVYVDLGVDMKIAVLARKATHRMRLELDDGRIDYRTLEHGLSRLEDSLLDFSLRDEALVLELGVPLLPTRGHGKPLVRWPLSPEDMTLAEQQHEVRLSVLAQPDLPPAKPKHDDPEDDQPSKFQLHELDATGIDIDLALEPARTSSDAIVRTLGFEHLSARGDVRYRPDDQDSGGRLTLRGEGLQLALAGLPVGQSRLDLGALRIHAITSVNVGMRGTTPSELALEVNDIALQNFKLA